MNNNQVFQKFTFHNETNILNSYNDLYTKEHASRVSDYAVFLGKHLGLSGSDLETLKLGALFHDIGKNEIPNNIIQKTSPLSQEEYTIIKMHTIYGAKLIFTKNIEVSLIIKYHHERFDGKGYPSNLQGKSIPYLARLVSIVDSFDAITSKRSYKSALDINYAKKELLENMGTQFDPEICKAFIELLDSNPKEIYKIQNKFRKKP